MSLTKEQAVALLEQLIDEERWQEALLVCRRIADELHESPQRLDTVLPHERPDPHQLRAEDTGSSLYLLGMMQYWGWGGAAQDREEAFGCYSRAAEKGHL